MAANLQFTGHKQMIAKLNNMVERSSNTYEAALASFMAVTGRVSSQMVPVDTGRLRGSINSEVQANRYGAKGAIAYNTPYAVHVHEKHRTHSKYLERAVQATASSMEAKLGQKIRTEMLQTSGYDYAGIKKV